MVCKVFVFEKHEKPNFQDWETKRRGYDFIRKIFTG